MPEINEREPEPIRGWLLLLSRLLIIWSPVTVGLSAANTISSLPLRGWPLGVVLVARLAVAGVGLSAGLALGARRPSAVRQATTALLFGAAMDVFLYTTSYYPNNIRPGEEPLYVAASLVYHGGWVAYLRWSRRVRETFPP